MHQGNRSTAQQPANTPNILIMIMKDSPAKDGASEPNPVPKVKNPRRLRIGEREVTAMCELLAQRLTEREGCQTLGISEATWYRWKSHARNSERLRKFLDRIVGQKIKTHLANIEAAAVGAGPHKRADWRASAYALSAADPTRFQPSGGVQVQINSIQPAIPASTIEKWLVAAYEKEPHVQGEVVDTWSEPRLLAEPAAAAEPAPPPRTRKAPAMFPKP